ncbi:MAG: ATP-dependent DNA helicase RecG [Acidimicrobiales bacterium]
MAASRSTPTTSASSSPTGDRAPLTLREFAELPVERLKGIGPKREKAFADLGITTVLDLLTHYPRRYIDRTKEATIAELRPGEEGMVLATVDKVSGRMTRTKKRMVTVTARDHTGKLTCTFFNQPWRERQLSPGTEAIFFGKLDVYRGVAQMTNPIVDLVGNKTGRIIAVYPQSEKAGLNTWEIGDAVLETLRRSSDRGIGDPLPPSLLERHRFIDRARAWRQIHDPQSMADVAEARRRLVFDELLRVQLALVLRKRALEAETKGIVHDAPGVLVTKLHERLPFSLTSAQRRAIDEIATDMAAPHPMHRLLQGDVGAGKTLVALSALLIAVEGGYQGALMAPTEVLAEQHHRGLRELASDLTVADDNTLMGERPVRIELLTNRITGSERKRLLADLAAGVVDIAVGTHALIQEGVSFASLGMVVIDEQHRFGVEQRAALREKSATDLTPDVLVMTATPIPRTAAMTVYGDLDVSVLDELPPGRTPITTVWAQTPLEEESVWQHVRDEVAEGRQVYVVCPLIDESETLEVRSAEETYAQLSNVELSGLKLGLLHGRLSSAEKEQVMTLFRAGKLDVLVATTVIEVGVDVPNATIMVILDAYRFGIAQLHQLRGRVGRGAQQSYCYLVGEATTPDGVARIEALVASTDGFALAEVDLDLRGEGTIMGERQKGRNDLKLASLRRDREWVVAAREAAFELVDHDPGLHSEFTLLRDEVELILGDEAAEFLMKS